MNRVFPIFQSTNRSGSPRNDMSLPQSTADLFRHDFVRATYGTLPGMQVLVWVIFEKKRSALDPANVTRLFDGETELSLVA